MADGTGLEGTKRKDENRQSQEDETMETAGQERWVRRAKRMLGELVHYLAFLP